MRSKIVPWLGALGLIVIGWSPARAADVVVVCPADFRPALTPWLDHRRGQGRTVELVSNLGTPAAIRARIRAAFGNVGSPPRGRWPAIVLIGDAAPRSEEDGRERCEITPVRHSVATVNVRFGSEPEIPDDNWYADLDDDGVPDAAIGRLTADTPAELTAIVEKVLAYERETDFGEWAQRVNFVAGVGGFGALADAALEQWARQTIAERVPPAYATTMTYCSWRSPYCPGAQCFRDETIARLNEGCLFWVYLGHGQPRHLDHVRVPGGEFPILSADDVHKLRAARGMPIAVLLACYAGAFDARRDCLAEDMLRAPGGPVAVVCGSRVTMPYAMSVLGTELMTECFLERRATLGELLLAAKRNTVLRDRDDDQSRHLDELALLLIPEGGDLAEERAEHLVLFNLLGDPLLRLPQPREMSLELAAQTVAGDKLSIAGQCDVDGRCQVELVVRRDRLTFKPPSREEYRDDRVARAEYLDVYRQANNPRWATAEAQVRDGHFQLELPVPPAAHGPCHIRVFVQGQGKFALGAADVRVERKPRRTAADDAPPRR
jgi:hypothetical protein